MWIAIGILVLGIGTSWVAYRFAPHGWSRTLLANLFMGLESIVALLGDTLGVVDLSAVLEPQYLTLTILVITLANGFFRRITKTPIGARK